MPSLKDRVSSRTRNIMKNVKMKEDCGSRASSSKTKEAQKEREDSAQQDIVIENALEKNTFGTEVVTVAPNFDHTYTSTDKLMNVNNVHIERSVLSLPENIVESVHKEIITNEIQTDVEFNRCEKVQTEINEVGLIQTQSTVVSNENIVQGNDTPDELFLEQGIFKGADEGTVTHCTYLLQILNAPTTILF